MTNRLLNLVEAETDVSGAYIKDREATIEYYRRKRLRDIRFDEFYGFDYSREESNVMTIGGGF